MNRNNIFEVVQIVGVLLIAACFVAAMVLLAYLIIFWHFTQIHGQVMPEIFYWPIQ